MPAGRPRANSLEIAPFSVRGSRHQLLAWILKNEMERRNDQRQQLIQRLAAYVSDHACRRDLNRENSTLVHCGSPQNGLHQKEG